MMTRGHLHHGRRAAGQRVLPLLLLAVLGACEDGAVQAVRELDAARGDCTIEGLRASDEECVRAAERYAGMAADLIDTYIGGVRTLDVALRRMPPARFDTIGLGYALSPEYRWGDPAGAGASPRLDWRSAGPDPAGPAYSRLRSGVAPPPLDRAARSRRAPFGYDAYREWPLSGSRYGRGFPGAGGFGPYGGGRFDPRFRDRGWFPGYGLDRYGDRYDPYWFDWRSAPYGYGGYGAFNDPYGYGGFDRGRYGDFGYAPYGYSAYPGDPYRYDAYGYVEPGYDPRWEMDPYRRGGLYDREDYAERDERWYDDAPAGEERTTGEDWGYLPEDFGSGVSAAEDGAAPPSTVAPARPAPHRPGFLLPPEERLRRPWIDD